MSNHCPECNDEIFDLNKWVADGKKHVGCPGHQSMSQRIASARAVGYREGVEAAMERADARWQEETTPQGRVIALAISDDISDLIRALLDVPASEEPKP